MTVALPSRQPVILPIIRPMIRPYADVDAAQLAVIHNQVYTRTVFQAHSFGAYMADTLAEGGLAWVVEEERPLGYALVSPIPGLPGLGDLSGCITPQRRRQGWGSQLLLHILDQLQESHFWQVVHRLGTLRSPAAHFLRHHNFFVEHEEWQLVLNDLQRVPALAAQHALAVATYPRNDAAPLFLDLYQQSFSGLPWDQPYTLAEVKADLGDPGDILFLLQQNTPVGFAWVDIDQQDRAQIEPLGILPAFQHKGYGRYLLIAAIQELKRRGARQIEIGAWRDNERALTLYRSLGFRHQKTFTYLAFNVKDQPM